MKALVRATAIAGVLCSFSTLAIAQTTTAPARPHHGLLSLLHRPKPMGHVNKPMFAGQIIGNKNSHIYHLPSDPGRLPAEKNRIYFHTEAQAIAAGYRHSGSGGHHAPGGKKHMGM